MKDFFEMLGLLEMIKTLEAVEVMERIETEADKAIGRTILKSAKEGIKVVAIRTEIHYKDADDYQIVNITKKYESVKDVPSHIQETHLVLELHRIPYNELSELAYYIETM